MSKFLDYDPHTGISNYFDFNEETGEAIITQKYDMTAVDTVVDYARAQAKDGLRDHGIKESWWHCAYLPMAFLMKLKLEYGIDPFKPENAERVAQEVERRWPHLKTTEKKIAGKPKEIYLPNDSLKRSRQV